MDLDRFLDDVERQRAIDDGEREEHILYTAEEYDALIFAAMRGGIIEDVEEIDTPDGDEIMVPDELMDWLEFCDWIKSGTMLIHLVLAGVLVPTRKDPESDFPYPLPAYLYERTENADVIMEDYGIGEIPE